MPITRSIIKSCCGKQAYLFDASKPIRKSQVKIFKDAGYSLPDHFLNSGLFYALKDGLVASSSFGTTRITVRCAGNDCSSKLDYFANLLERAINS